MFEVLKRTFGKYRQREAAVPTAPTKAPVIPQEVVISSVEANLGLESGDFMSLSPEERMNALLLDAYSDMG